MQRKSKALLFLSLLLCAKLSPAGQVATVSGTELFVVDCTNQALTLRFRVAGKVPQAVRTNNIRKEAGSATAVAWSITWQVPQPSMPAITEYQVMGAVSGTCPAAGRFVVPLTVVFADGTQDNLDIRVVRAAEPVLDLPASVVLRTDLPVAGGLPYVPSIRLRETSGAAAIEGLSVSGGQLKNAAGELVDTVLNPALSSSIVVAGQGTDLKLRVSSEPSVGTYTTRLTVHSPALKQSQAIDVTFKVAFLPVYLFITILVGVVIGWVVNVRLAGRAALDTARLEAYRAAGALGRRAAQQKDPTVQQRFIALVAALESDIRDARTPAEVQAALTKSAGGADAIELEAGKAAEALRLALLQVHEQLAPGHVAPDAMVREKLEALAGQLVDIDAAAAAGDVIDAQRRLDAFRSTLAPSLAAALQPWLLDLYESLHELGEWSAPAQALEQERGRILTLVTAAYQATAGQFVSECDKVAIAVRTLTAFTAPRAIAEAFRAAAVALQAAKPAVALALSALAAEVLRQTASDAEPLNTLQRLTAVRRDVEARMQLEMPGDAGLRHCLETGNFPGAAAVIAPPAAMPPAAPGPLPTPIARTTPPALPAAAPPKLICRILVPALLPLDRMTTVKLDWPGGAPPRPVVWKCDGAAKASIANENSNGAEITPSQAGFLTIMADLGGGDVVTAQTYAGNLMQTPDLVKLAKESAKVNWSIWFFTAALTSLTGYLIFVNAWMGSGADFFAAFVWGFFGQFSLDRIRDTVKTTTARTLP
ncbi:hypothetical protein LRH25_20275 [Ideonella azotifigens]|uniref:Uncharacterized protein n=1 Tax=Ideonella azotifigens TaxID=513160 RepID=A0ABN1JZI2_9BURK|nr:hypothetical protein [Ideonella azotifigens]MCD2342667.1 hypothetical protein [Ideonella azotifigens]